MRRNKMCGCALIVIQTSVNLGLSVHVVGRPLLPLVLRPFFPLYPFHLSCSTHIDVMQTCPALFFLAVRFHSFEYYFRLSAHSNEQ